MHHFYVKPFIIDRHELSRDTYDRRSDILIYAELGKVQRAVGSAAIDEELVYKAVEVQLALLYDTQYTKVPVIHARYGYCIRAFSLVAPLAALVIFTASKRDGHTHSTPDTAITYLLLAGALALEIMSAFKAIGSTWTYAAVIGCSWRRLARAILSARYRLVILKDGRWSNSVGQYNLISSLDRETKLRGILPEWIGLQDWWNRVHYTRHAKLSPALKKFVLLLLRKRNNTNRNLLANRRPGDWAPRNCTGFDQLDWSFDCGFEERVLIWHMATGVFLGFVEDQRKLHREAINTLSDYMMYILRVHRDILPVKPRRRTLFDDICTRFDEAWWHRQGEPIPAYGVVQRYISRTEHPTGDDLVVSAWDLFEILRDMESDLDKKMEAIGSVWMEMLCYAATNASGDFHAKQLSNGGEFATHVLLLMKHISATPEEKDTLRSSKPSEVELSHKSEKPADHVELNVDNDGNDDISESP